MQALLVATNSVASQIIDAIERKTHPRVEYINLARQLKAEFVDYGDLKPNMWFDYLENKLRLDMRLALLTNKLCRHKKIQVLVSMSERVGLPLKLLLPPAVRHMIIFHHPLSHAKLLLLKVLKFFQRRVQYIAISHAEAYGLRSALGLPEEAVATLHTPVDTNFYTPLEAEPDDVPRHFTALGLSYRDYPTLVRAMQAMPEVICHIRAGSTWVKRASGLEDKGIPANVLLKPFVPPTELRKVIAQSQFVSVPIRHTTQWSAGCTTVQIAQAMGKAVITTRLPGLAEYVREGETGVLIPPGDVSAMRSAIHDLWHNPDKAQAMGRAGRAFIKEHFSLEKWSVKMTTLMKTQLENPL